MSCGCHRKEKIFYKKKYAPEMYVKQLKNTWNNMKRRCYDVNNAHYKDYGLRGIVVCDEWLGENGYVNFYNWSINNGFIENKKLTIDRIDNDKGYSPDNCRWVNMTVQSNNRRSNIKITYLGKTQTLTEWCREYGINIRTGQRRYEIGWDIESIITIPPTTNSTRNKYKIKRRKDYE